MTTEQRKRAEALYRFICKNRITKKNGITKKELFVFIKLILSCPLDLRSYGITDNIIVWNARMMKDVGRTKFDEKHFIEGAMWMRDRISKAQKYR